MSDLKPMGKARTPMSTAWTPTRPGTSAPLGSDVGATACHRCHCSVTSVIGSFRLCSAFCWLCDLSDSAFMPSPETKTTSKAPSTGFFLPPSSSSSNRRRRRVQTTAGRLAFSDYPEISLVFFVILVLVEPMGPDSTGGFGLDPRGADDAELRVTGDRNDAEVAEDPMTSTAEDPMTSTAEDPKTLHAEDPKTLHAEDPTTSNAEDPKISNAEDLMTSSFPGAEPTSQVSSRVDSRSCHDVSEDLRATTIGGLNPMTLTCRAESPRSPPSFPDDHVNERVEGRVFVDSPFVDNENPNLPTGDAFASSSSCSSDSKESSDEDVSLEVGQTRKVKLKTKAKVCPDPPGSSLSDPKSLRRLRRHCEISEEIVLIAPTPADRADAPPAGYMTLFENYFDQCLLWFPLPRFLMRYLAVHGVCLAQINPRGIRHLLGIYVLSRECGVDISIENLSYLTDFRTRGLSEELKYSVANSSGMTLIAGFPSKDDNFEYRFFFVEISERTVEADCIDLVKTRWERRVKPTMPKVSKEFLAAMHKELSSGNGNWRRSFSRKRIERALSSDILPRKVLGRGQARLCLREQIALEAAAKARGSSGTGAPRVATPTTSTPPAPSTRARTSRPSAPKAAPPPPSSGDKRQRADAFPAVAVSGEASPLGGDGLLRAEAYAVVKSRYSELSLLFDCLVGDYDEDVRSRGSELSAAKEANAALQSRLNETVERNDALERDALALQRVKKDYEDKLSKLKSRCAKAEGERPSAHQDRRCHCRDQRRDGSQFCGADQRGCRATCGDWREGPERHVEPY
ncbi:hypothetical protein AALP_AA6G335900 [Arabis alpina]|uniref:Uncharacterized protein n=1 Tax=Arabis alpina TaxID=50452 RepID=A0A087GTD6_ARAAL|nr:hypothetical protein AALP_AA6G335900 [Arabis alpina]